MTSEAISLFCIKEYPDFARHCKKGEKRTMANSGLNLFYDSWGGLLMEMLEHVSIAHDYQKIFQS